MTFTQNDVDHLKTCLNSFKSAQTALDDALKKFKEIPENEPRVVDGSNFSITRIGSEYSISNVKLLSELAEK
jgi:hypothetical protein